MGSLCSRAGCGFVSGRASRVQVFSARGESEKDVAGLQQPTESTQSSSSLALAGLKQRPRVSLQDIEHEYHIGGIIGEGHDGEVRIVTHKISGCQFAMKSFEKRFFLPVHVELDHPFILRHLQLYETATHVHMVMELCQGGTLFDRVFPSDAPLEVESPRSPRSPLSAFLLPRSSGNQNTRPVARVERLQEAEAKRVVFQLLLAINYLHSTLKVIDRDCKLENVMFAQRDNFDTLRLIDLGFAIPMLTEGGPEEELTIHHDPCIVGTLWYLSAEVLNRKYSSKVDVWSVGVMAFTVLCGRLPFMANGNLNPAAAKQVILGKIRAGDFRVSECVSETGKDFLKRLLCIYPNSRLSAKEALGHAWLEEVVQDFKMPIFPPELVGDFRWFANLPVLQRAVYVLSACLAPSFESIDYYSRVFISWDQNFDGRISRTEFREILALHQEEVIHETQADRLFDAFGAEFLAFNDFLAAAAIKHVVHDFPFIPELVFSRLAGNLGPRPGPNAEISHASLESALGCAKLLGVAVADIPDLPLNFEVFCRKFFGPELLIDSLLGSINRPS